MTTEVRIQDVSTEKSITVSRKSYEDGTCVIRFGNSFTLTLDEVGCSDLVDLIQGENPKPSWTMVEA